MLFSLRNDVVAIEYPIQHFISEGLRNGEFPAWFNTWNMGFPLQSTLSWGVYSTPQMLTGILFESNIYILHAEFIFFIIAAGCCMYKLLKTHFLTDPNLALLFACCYMLSGFTVGSSQWLLYITGMTFIPLVIYCLLSLLKKPSAKYSVLFSIAFFLFFTNVHIYLTVLFFYVLVIFLCIYFAKLFLTREKSKQEKQKIFNQTLFSLLLAAILCAAPAYYSYEVITYLARSQPLATNSSFFQSNYLHPDGLTSLLLPLSSIRISHANTEGIIQNTYLGLLPLLLLPVSVIVNLKQKNNTAWNLLIVSLIFLFISFGHLTPIRDWLNVLPGMAHFRHPGVLRLFFIFFFVLYLSSSFKKHSLTSLTSQSSLERKSIIATLISLSLVSLIILIFNSGNFSATWKGSAYQTIKNINNEELLAINAFIQIIFIIFLLLSINKKQRFFSFLIIAELIINTLICTPFFTLSTYSAKEVDKILASPSGFPIQQTSPQVVPGTITDARNNSWFNINTYRKEISNNLSMSGPLIINNISLFLSDNSAKEWLAGRQIIFINDTLISTDNILKIVSQYPGKVTAQVSLVDSKEIILQQANFPGWKAYYNNQEIALSKNKTPFVSTNLPSGIGEIVFKFEKPGVIYSAIILHLTVLLTLSISLVKKIRSKLSSLS